MRRDRQTTETVIRAGKGARTVGELSRYKDLIFLFARRNITVKYKQTVLGPLWLIVMPVLSAVVSSFIFGGIAKISGGGVPYFLFYFVGFTAWSFFASCFQQNANVFVSNAAIFRKVYFPRLTVPLSNLLCALFAFAIQFAVMAAIMIICACLGIEIHPAWHTVWLLPFLLIYLAALGLGLGSLSSALTAKYRDLTGVVPMLIDLWKYVTPVVYLSADLPVGLRWIAYVNPVSCAVEGFRYIFLGGNCGALNVPAFLIGTAETAILLALGIFAFRRTERKFVDTV